MQATESILIRAKLAPPGAIVRTSTGAEYVKCHRIDSVMRWGQPIPGSGDWLVEVVGREVEATRLVR